MSLGIQCFVKYVRERQILYVTTYMYNLKKNEIKEQKQIHRYTIQTNGYHWDWEVRGVS